MTVYLSEKAARKAGLLPPRKAKTTRVAVPRDGAVSRCHTCGETFTGDTAENRHVDETNHARIESVFTTS